MNEMIVSRREAEIREERYDLLNSLLDANDSDGLSSDDANLTTSELIGNIFIFLIAGHETTAHTLSFAFALLALYQDEQEALYNHIKDTVPDCRIPAYEDMPRLTHCLAVLYETLRMFPSVTGIPKKSAEDTVLVTSNAAGEKKHIPVPKGTNIVISTPGLHYNRTL
jgi:cytochrome P450